MKSGRTPRFLNCQCADETGGDESQRHHHAERVHREAADVEQLRVHSAPLRRRRSPAGILSQRGSLVPEDYLTRPHTLPVERGVRSGRVPAQKKMAEKDPRTPGVRGPQFSIERARDHTGLVSSLS